MTSHGFALPKMQSFSNQKTDNNAADKIVTPRSQRVYTMTKCNRNSPTLESLNQNASYDDQCKTLLLPHDSKYAFMAKKEHITGFADHPYNTALHHSLMC